MCQRGFALAALWFVAAAGLAADGNRLTYLDEYCDPYDVGLHTPRLIAPQWLGENGVRAVIALTIDDLRNVRAYEDFLRPILNRLKRIDGRAPVSIFGNRIDPDDSHLQQWLADAQRWSVHRFTSMAEGWSGTMMSGARGDEGAIPAIVRADGTNNGVWFKFNHMWVQNEETGAKSALHCDKRPFIDLLGKEL